MLWLQRGLNVAMITLRSALCYNYIKDWMLLWLHRSLNVAMIKQMFECPYDYTEGLHVVAGLNVAIITLRSKCSLYDNTVGPKVAMITQRVNRWQNVVIITLRSEWLHFNLNVLMITQMSECCYDYTEVWMFLVW